jgi:hypothetical protein
MDVINIYWSNYTNANRIFRQALFLDKWKPLLPDLYKRFESSRRNRVVMREIAQSLL